ncbi:hypothetical protein KQ51_00757 [Candidatus Izimaplasma bacterium HR1]|uniref:hypothetical protein n=1 Tax=Candidatus Izimoplasma sp. HR1 TaxID=1541959 RepID=UPI0004F5C74A|nr:hypothetical protein KQ51_00757 [Candidatus Izimaplasma bacterium HR1]
MGNFLVIAGILLIIVAIYIGSYYLNANTKAPEGAKEVGCDTCNSLSCSLRKKDGPDDIDDCEVARLD